MASIVKQLAKESAMQLLEQRPAKLLQEPAFLRSFRGVASAVLGTPTFPEMQL